MPLTVRYEPPKRNAALLLNAAAPGAAQIAGKLLLDASQQLVPVDTGELRASGKVEADGPHGVRISYDAVAPDGYPYGIKQHEDLALAHPHGGQAKFLEKPMHTEGPTIIQAIAEALRVVL